MPTITSGLASPLKSTTRVAPPIGRTEREVGRVGAGAAERRERAVAVAEDDAGGAEGIGDQHVGLAVGVEVGHRDLLAVAERLRMEGGCGPAP